MQEKSIKIDFESLFRLATFSFTILSTLCSLINIELMIVLSTRLTNMHNAEDTKHLCFVSNEMISTFNLCLQVELISMQIQSCGFY